MAKVEELLARVDVARERLAKVPAVLEGFPQYGLTAAFDGQLRDTGVRSKELLTKVYMIFHRLSGSVI